MIVLNRDSLVMNSRSLVTDVSLVLAPGEVTVIAGPNGAGKSSLLKLLAGVISPSAGTACLDGQPMRRLSPGRLAARRAMLVQASETTFGFTVRELVALGPRLLEPPVPPRKRALLVQRALDCAGLSAMQDQLVHRLSGGERQRAHLARVLAQLWAGEAAGGRGILLLDEPIAAQDLSQQLRVLDIACRHAAEGGAVAVVLHDLNWASRIADRLVVMRHGRIHASGAPAMVLTRRVLAEAFGVDVEPGMLAPCNRPYILPHLVSLPDEAQHLINQGERACISR